MRANIPQELRDLPQWVVAGPDKKPRNPRTGNLALPSDATTGGTFDDACSAGFPHIGFILSPNDPFAVIDLDNPFERLNKATGAKEAINPNDPDFPQAVENAKRHSLILQNFPTYAEKSQSGTGAHIVMRGTIPAGVRSEAAKVEVYSSDRYMIFTGDLMREMPVVDCQPLLMQLFDEMGGMREQGALVEGEEVEDDQTLIDRMASASNAEKFLDLWNGHFAHYPEFPSQSEADYSLISFLTFYTENNEQVRRLFRFSALGKREKAQRDSYIDRMMRKIRAKMPPPIDFSSILLAPEAEETHAAAPAEQMELIPSSNPAKPAYAFPPGLVGQVADYIFRSSIRPVHEVALASAIALCAGIAGRSYNVSATGLNQYVVVLAETGVGKEGGSSGIDALVSAVRHKMNCALVDNFLGPASFSSGQAVVRNFDAQPCFLSIMGEIGKHFKEWFDPNSAKESITRVLLDIYNKSGWTKTLRSAAYADSEKNTKIVQAPNLSIFGDATPSTFYDALDSAKIEDGLVPRFTVIEYHGKRPPKNKAAFFEPEEKLVDDFTSFVQTALNTTNNQQCFTIPITPEAQRIHDDFDVLCDSRINDNPADAERQLWNRGDMKALKMAGLIAVGMNWQTPVIDEVAARWAVDLIQAEIDGVLKRFKSGAVGGTEEKQIHAIKHRVGVYLAMPSDKRLKYRVTEEAAARQVVPFHYVNSYCRKLAVFTGDRRGASAAIEKCLENMVKTEQLERLTPADAVKQYKMRSALYVTGATW